MGNSLPYWGPGVILSLAVVASAGAGFDGPLVGFTELEARLGDQTPTGAGVVVSQVEAGAVAGAYGPNQSLLSEFGGKTFFAMSGDPGSSSHATEVGSNQYGLISSIAPGVDEIYLYAAGHWLGSGYLNLGLGVEPEDLPGPIKLLNNSWIADSGAANNEAVRRADFAADRDDVIVTNGVNNGGPSQPLFSHMFNGIAVGMHNGTHTSDDTAFGVDGPGRMKPEIVAPGDATSWSTPVVNAAGSLLVETARTWDGLSDNPNAEISYVIKAALFAGAKHEDIHDGEWSNNPITSGPLRGVTDSPIDDVVGVGTVNIDRSHRILTMGEQTGSTSVPVAPNAEYAGWDHAPVGHNQSRYWRINVTKVADEVSILASWNRFVHPTFGGWAIGEFTLRLWRIDNSADGELSTLVGDPGLRYFESGNVVSESPVDNLEHLYVQGLAPGEYVIELERLDTLFGFPNWDAAVAWIFPEQPTTNPADLNGDGVVGFADLLLILNAWGPCEGCAEDLDGSGDVGFADLLILLSEWS